MKLESGMYARTSGGSIFKLGYYNEKEKRWISVEEYDWYPVYESSVVKASNNIIDLIEEGDYVNGYKVTHRTKSLLGFEDGQDGDWYLSNENIKSIVTKEQFESMSYKVKE